jgi:hypothetical protein
MYSSSDLSRHTAIAIQESKQLVLPSENAIKPEAKTKKIDSDEQRFMSTFVFSHCNILSHQALKTIQKTCLQKEIDLPGTYWTSHTSANILGEDKPLQMFYLLITTTTS